MHCTRSRSCMAPTSLGGSASNVEPDLKGDLLKQCVDQIELHEIIGRARRADLSYHVYEPIGKDRSTNGHSNTTTRISGDRVPQRAHTYQRVCIRVSPFS